MGLVIAYFLVWLLTVLYVVRLGTRQRHLERSVDALEARLQASRRPSTTARAA
jgi:CcmD family protein